MGNASSILGWQVAGSLQSLAPITQGCQNIASFGGGRWATLGLKSAVVEREYIFLEYLLQMVLTNIFRGFLYRYCQRNQLLCSCTQSDQACRHRHVYCSAPSRLW
jgi:hypothetical protein